MHTNGYTLARKVLLERFDVEDTVDELEQSIGKELLSVHKSYLHEIRPLIGDPDLKGVAHITGGGLLGNTARIIPEGLHLAVDWSAWDIPPIFRLIQDLGEIPESEMRRTFNLGIGLVVIVPEEKTDSTLQHFNEFKADPKVIGQIVSDENSGGK